MHLIYAKPANSSDGHFLFAKDVKTGDFLQLLDSWVKITSIKKEISQGIFAPLTLSGKALVNGILVSNYAYLPNHDTIHKAFYPFRVLYSVFGQYVNIKTVDGLNWYAKLLMKISENIPHDYLNYKRTN